MALLSSVLKQLPHELSSTHYLTVFFCIFLILLQLIRRNKYNLPPSPPKIPIIGNLHQLGTLPHRSFHALSHKYGPLMMLQLGQIPTLVVSSADVAREIIKTHDVVFSNRRQPTAAKIFGYGCKDVAFVYYGEEWRQKIKTCKVELMSLKKVRLFHSIRQEVVTELVEAIGEACGSERPCVNLTEMLMAASNDIVSRCVLGRKCDDACGGSGSSSFAALGRKIMRLFSAFSVGDFFPSLGWVDYLTGLIPEMKTTFLAVDAFLDEVIAEHESSNKKNDDFLGILLQLQECGRLDFQLDRDNLKAILVDMIIGGSDTTSTTLEWTFAEFLRNPNTMKKAQEEVRRVVGINSKAVLDENCVNQMNYLKCVVKETLRLHPPLPLLIARETSSSVKLRGYDIPAKTMVFINAWAIQRDPELWDDSEEFIPERFETSQVDLNGQDFQLIPFGIGRRGCPAMSFGLASTEENHRTPLIDHKLRPFEAPFPAQAPLLHPHRPRDGEDARRASIHLLHDYQLRHLGPAAKILALGLSSRKNLCVNPRVLAAENRDSVDAGCRKLTASWVRAVAAENPSVPSCEFFEQYERAGSSAVLPPGVYTLQDLRAYGKEKGWCPYYLARHMVQFANVVVYSYQYLLDPKVAGIISKEMQKESVVVFDEAHNIDNVCIEALSVSVRRQTIEGARRNLSRMRQEIDKFKATDAGRLRAEYNRLVEGLALRGDLPATDAWLANPALPDDILKEAVPGNIRRAEHFIHVLRRLVQYLEGRLDTENVEKESPVSFVVSILNHAGIDQKALKFCYDRLHSLMMTLEITDTDEFLHIQTICDFATLVGTYARGFSIIIEPFDERMPHIPDPVLQLCCHDASLAIKPVFERFQSVVITSGTLSPIDLYPRLLNFSPVVSRSFTMSLTRDCICPMVLTRGSDQLPVSTKFDMRSDLGVVRNYGRLLLEMASVVPDGIVCFFVSYSYMDGIVNTWNENGILKEIMQHKLVFIETQDVVETTLALDNYRKACDCGRGAIFFSVARGKVAEGIDFDRHYGRLVIMFGVPFQYTLSKILLARLEYLRDTFQIKEGDFLTFDALRQAAQCVGRVIRSKADYGMMIFADKRYSRHDKRSKLPSWILSHLHDAHLNLSTDMALHIAREFLRKMAQPYDKTGGTGRKTLLSQEDLEKMAVSGLDDMMY